MESPISINIDGLDDFQLKFILHREEYIMMKANQKNIQKLMDRYELANYHNISYERGINQFFIMNEKKKLEEILHKENFKHIKVIIL